MAAPIYDSVLTNVLSEFGVTNLKEQKQMLDCLINGKDCMAILPTGFGKSLPFQIYLPVVRGMIADQTRSDWKALVCCPLASLMQDQVEKLTRIPVVSAAYKGVYTFE
jgi:superfamily II DNA helicase RecQ